jgi:hypothetical protein
MTGRAILSPRTFSAAVRRAGQSVCACLAFTLVFVSAQPAHTAPAFLRPNVLILVYALSSGQGQVGVTYPTVVPHAQAQRDLKALQAETGWRFSGVKITDLPPPIQNAKGKMTGLECTVSGALTPRSDTLEVAPFINAFRGYHQIGLTYFTEPGFGFQGLRDYADNHVQIAMTQHGTTYSYQIVVRDPHFGRLTLPRYQMPPGQARSVSAGGAAPHPMRPWLVALVLLAALGAGAVVYSLLARQL